MLFSGFDEGLGSSRVQNARGLETQNNMKNYSFKSAAIHNGLCVIAADLDFTKADEGNFASFVQKAVRLDIEQNGIRHDVRVESNGKTKTIKSGSKDGEFKNAGKGSTQKLVFSGEKIGTLLLKCRWLTKALVAQDEALALLEDQGFGLGFAPAADSETYEQIVKLSATFKPAVAPEPQVAPEPATAN